MTRYSLGHTGLSAASPFSGSGNFRRAAVAPLLLSGFDAWSRNALRHSNAEARLVYILQLKLLGAGDRVAESPCLCQCLKP